MKTSLISITPDAEKTIMYCARVSNPANQNSDNTKLLKYCAEHHHWSVFEMANAVIEIETSRAISAQILRHRSFSFQEFSQRYALVTNTEKYRARRQDTMNRQNSIDDLDELDQKWFMDTQDKIERDCMEAYASAIGRGIAKEQARFLLPISTQTRLYMNGTIRSWIHYIELRSSNGTQLEHREIAISIRELLKPKIPTIAEVLGW